MDAWDIYCDFDGTVSTTDIVDSLLARHGMPGWEALEADWRAGRIGSRACMSGQVELLDFDHVQLGHLLEATAIDPAFPAFVAEARRSGSPLQIVSDGLDYAITVILRRHELSVLPFAANHLRRLSERRWQLDSPWQAAGCESGMCKCAYIARTRAKGRRTLLIGDGASDFCAAGRVDFVFAKHRLIEHCRARGIPHAPIADFAGALELLPRLLAGKLTAAAPELAMA